jgi:hypothetical protein
MKGADAQQFAWAGAWGRKEDLTSDYCCSLVARLAIVRMPYIISQHQRGWNDACKEGQKRCVCVYYCSTYYKTEEVRRKSDAGWRELMRSSSHGQKHVAELTLSVPWAAGADEKMA